MTPTEKGRRYDALYYGHRTTQELCEMVVQRESDMDDLRTQNGRLRELCSALATRVRVMQLTGDMFALDARVIQAMDELGVDHGE